MDRKTLVKSLSAVCLITSLATSCQNTVTDPSLSNFDTLVLTAVTGDFVQGTAGQPSPIQIRVSDEVGRSVAGVSVELAVLGDGGIVSPSFGWTGEDGLVDAVWVLGTKAGEQELEVTTNDSRFGSLFRRLRLRALVDVGVAYSVEVSPSGASLEVDQTQPFEALVRDRYGNIVEDASIDWSVSDGQVASVADSGVLTALKEGTTSLTATTQTSAGDRIQGYAWISVAASSTEGGSEPPPTDGGDPAEGTPGSVNDLQVVTVTDHSVTLSWTEVDDGTGQPASYLIQSRNLALSSSEERSIPGGTIGQTTTYEYDGLSAGQDYGFRVGAYSGTLGTDAVFGTPSDIVTAATSENPDATPSAVTSVVASEESHSFSALNETAQLFARAYDDGGQLISDASFTWKSLDPSIVFVTGDGVISSAALGSTLVVVTAACCAQASDTVEVTVTQVPSGVQVSPTSVVLQVGESDQLNANVVDSNGMPVTSTSVAWSSSDPSVASINGAGMTTGVAPGSALLEAKYAGLTGQSSAEVPTADTSGGGSDGGSTGGSGGGSTGGGGSSGTGLNPNEPAGFLNTANMDRPFDEGGELGWSYKPDGSSTFVQDASAPYSPSGVVQHNYAAGTGNGGQGNGTAYDGSNIPDNHGEVYIHTVVKFSPNWVTRWANLKAAAATTPGNELQPWFQAFDGGYTSGGIETQLVTQGTDGAGTQRFRQNLSGYRLPVNTWGHMELYVKLNAPNQNDAVIDMWLYADGEAPRHVAHYDKSSGDWGGMTPGVLIGPNMERRYDQIKISSINGGIGCCLDEDIWVRYDHFYASVR